MNFNKLQPVNKQSFGNRSQRAACDEINIILSSSIIDYKHFLFPHKIINNSTRTSAAIRVIEQLYLELGEV